MAGVPRVELLLAGLVVLSLMVPGVAAGIDGQDASQQAIAGSDVEADDILLAIDLQSDGDAEWQVEYRVRLDDDETSEAFDSLQRDIEDDPENYTATFHDRMAATADGAQDATGREMSVENVTVETETRQLPREYGIVTYRFTWTGFATVSGDRIEAGDAIAGLFLDQGTTLLIAWPETHRVDTIDPTPDEQGATSATWDGPREFGSDRPMVVLTSEPAEAEPTTGVPSGLLPLAAVGALVLFVLVGVRWYRRGGTAPWSGTADGTTDGETAEGGTEDGRVERGAAEGADGTATGEGTPEDPVPGGVPDELLSNEERVLQLLENHGGRMKQQQVVEQLEWTDAKTSQVVGKLREQGEVETFRIGRENVLTLPDETEL